MQIALMGKMSIDSNQNCYIHKLVMLRMLIMPGNGNALDDFKTSGVVITVLITVH